MNFAVTKTLSQSIKSRFAFTLAEVLITLGIIGVVAAMTIPSLMATYQRHIVETKLKDTYSVMANAIKLAEEEYGVGFDPTDAFDSTAGWSSARSSASFEKYFAPYLKLNFKYPQDKCVKLTEAYTPNGVGKFIDYNHTCYALMNGVAISYYAGKNSGDTKFSSGFTVTLNQTKEKRFLGRDVFGFRIVDDGNGLYLTTIGKNYATQISNEDLKKYCGSNNDNGRINVLGGSFGNASFCTELIMRNGWKIPPNYPIKF